MDYKNIWLTILTRLEPTISRGKFLTWFANTAVLGIEGSRLTLGVPTAFARDWLQSKYALKILQAAQEQNAALTEIEFAVDTILADGNDPRTVNLAVVFGKPGDKKVRKVAGTQEVAVTSSGIRSGLLNPRYTLANFVPGEENRLAHVAALSVARTPGQTYNPLVIYGGVGLGKTHLLSAIGHEVLTNNPNKVVVYLTAEMFMNEYIASVKRAKTDEFRRRYRDADVLLVDDVQFLAEKEQTQIEFFNVFNAVHSAGKQIVVTSDRAPHQLDGLMDRLKSRLTWGLVAEVEQPQYKSRLEILKLKAREHRAIIDPRALELIAERVTVGVRALEGVLTTVLAESDLLKCPPTLARIERLLGKISDTEQKVQPVSQLKTVAPEHNPDAIVALVAGKFGVSHDEMVSPSRRRDIASARAVAMLLLRDMFQMSFSAIGAKFSRDHATVMHAIEKARNTSELALQAATLREG